MRTIEKTVFTFDELTDTAKEKARDWYRRGALDYDWWDGILEDFVHICSLLGIETHTPDIFFSGFYSQGYGASFRGNYTYKKGCVNALTDYAPDDKELRRVAEELASVQRKNFYQLRASIGKQSSRYTHEMTMFVDVERDDDKEPTADAQDCLEECMRELARWLYRTLEAEYEYLRSNEPVDEALLANAYEFDEEGGRV